MYAATRNVSRVDANSFQLTVEITFNGVKLRVLNEQAQGKVPDPTKPEIIYTLNAAVPKVGRQLAHTLDVYDHDAAHLYISATLKWDNVPAWQIEIFAQPDTDPSTPHVYWPRATRLDSSAPMTIESVS